MRGFREKGIPAEARAPSTAAKWSRHGPHRKSRIDGASAVARTHRSALQSSTRSGFRSRRRRQSSHSSPSRAARIFRQPRVVGGTALRVAERVDLEGYPAQARLREESVQERHRLGVGVRRVGAEQLRAHLVELPHPPLLRSLVPEHRADVVEPDRPLARAGPVIEERADHRRGPLGAHREALPGPVGEGVHLLLDDVGRLPHGPREELGALEQGGPDLPEAVPRRRGRGTTPREPPIVRTRGEGCPSSPGRSSMSWDVLGVGQVDDVPGGFLPAVHRLVREVEQVSASWSRARGTRRSRWRSSSGSSSPVSLTNGSASIIFRIRSATIIASSALVSTRRTTNSSPP